jgi:DNA repair and recombination protein RAD54B
MSDASGKLIALAALLKALKTKTDEKIVVVSNFTQTLDVLEELCKSRQYAYCRLDGQVV